MTKKTQFSDLFPQVVQRH